jgi:hypothetical protein
MQQTHQPETELRTVLQLAENPRHLDEIKLEKWLQILQNVRRHLPNAHRSD